MESASGAKESNEEDKDTDKAVVESEGSKAASGRNQEASDHFYKKPLVRTYPSLAVENIYDTVTGWLRKR